MGKLELTIEEERRVLTDRLNAKTGEWMKLDVEIGKIQQDLQVLDGNGPSVSKVEAGPIVQDQGLVEPVVVPVVVERKTVEHVKLTEDELVDMMSEHDITDSIVVPPSSTATGLRVIRRMDPWVAPKEWTIRYKIVAIHQYLPEFFTLRDVVALVREHEGAEADKINSDSLESEHSLLEGIFYVRDHKGADNRMTFHKLDPPQFPPVATEEDAGVFLHRPKAGWRRREREKKSRANGNGKKHHRSNPIVPDPGSTVDKIKKLIPDLPTPYCWDDVEHRFRELHGSSCSSSALRSAHAVLLGFDYYRVNHPGPKQWFRKIVADCDL